MNFGSILLFGLFGWIAWLVLNAIRNHETWVEASRRPSNEPVYSPPIEGDGSVGGAAFDIGGACDGGGDGDGD